MVDKNRIAASNVQISDAETEKKKYKKLLAKRVGFLGACVILLFIVAGISLALGSASISFTEAYSAVFSRLFPDWLTVSKLADTVVWHLRLPRILVAILAGAIFAMSGSTTQAILRNPLATPYTLGVSAGAGRGIYWHNPRSGDTGRAFIDCRKCFHFFFGSCRSNSNNG